MSHTVAEIVDYVRENGGATFGRNYRLLEMGWPVGGLIPAIKIPVDSLTPEALAAALDLFEGELIGCWISAGLVWIEPVDLHGGRERAIRVGRERREEAVYGLHTGEYVELT